MNLNSVIYMLLQDEKCRESFESTVISQQTQACYWTLKLRRKTYLNGSRSMGDGKKWMLTKFARTAAGNPHAGNLGRKENCSILMHIQEEGRKGIVWWCLLQMFKNFSAKISACKKPEQTDNLLVPAMERSGPAASTDGAALLLCLHTELISL